ncbi:SGNH/GDSL hydrolase family protein [Paraburkholderia dioscoreae]|uniref:Acylhydrolase n=1 Tax=Paraburkholderia dioscoreae TaxID=2604047 RepID=A0A5Q4ZHW4_9BURK|nr:SGNH/GDSL hydrolase family protein [Paraburkholderia dioscoreae]VVD30916.1 Acylhydrolase [Paraburkholderia dioscoreae]
MKSTNQINTKAGSDRSPLTRFAQLAIASAAFAMLAACGGGGGGGGSSSTGSNNAATSPGGINLQVVSFGDSLSDVGTYAPVITASFGGGRFTTNPGEVWTQKVAEYYGGSLTAAYLGGFGQPLAPSTGFGYAQGGSRVQDPDGEGHAPAGVANAAYAQATTVPVTQQVQNYLSAHGSFNSNQLVLINGGANDIFELEPSIQAAIAADVAGGMDPAVALQKEATASLGPVAQTFAGVVKQIVASGATHVVVSNVPDIGQTPLGVTSGAAAQQLLTGLATVYNAALAQSLQALGLSGSQVIQIDAFGWQDGITTDYQTNGFTVSNTGTACNLQSMAANATAYGTQHPEVLNGLTAAQYGASLASSLFCSPQTYTVAGADQTYMFADNVHPSTHLHALFAQYVQQQIAKTGLGK